MMMYRIMLAAVFFHIQVYFTAGIYLYHATDLTVDNFTLICDLNGTMTTFVTFSYDGNAAGACTSPPGPTCGSSIGNITIDLQTVKFILDPKEVLSKGNAVWKCAHGPAEDDYSAVVISYSRNKKVEFEDKKIVISCNCGFPYVQADIEYKDGNTVVGEEKVNLTSSMASCSPDSRAMDFSSTIANYPSEAAIVCATIKTSQEITVPICLAIDCGFSLAGFIPVFLIELFVFIDVMILLKLKKRIGGYSILKVVVSCVYLGIALIIGLILGFVLQKCNENNLSIGLGVGLGCLLAVAHIVTVYVIHKKCEDTKKDDDDDGRKGTPASTSKDEFTDRKVSHVHLGTINGNKVDSHPKEPHRSLLESHRSSPEPHRSLLEPHRSLPEPHRSLPEPHRSLPEPHRPLPEPPATHPKQLDPIDDGATSSEKKKKKKKKKKKRSEAREEPEDQQE